MSSLKSFLTAKNFIAIPLKFTCTNHFELKVKVNGVKGRFILDTGASNSCIGIDRVTFFGLRLEDSEVKAAGAGATNMETHIAKENTVNIGKWKKRSQKIVVFDLTHVNQALIAHNEQAVDGIIGADILRKGKAVIDYRKNRLFLKNK